MNSPVSPEMHLLIIWQNARYRQSEILQEIAKAVSIVDVIEVEWSNAKFSENMTRFYGQKLPSQSHKEKHCGRGPFLLVIVRDEKPQYMERDTISRSIELVNINMFDLKMKLRKLTGGGHRIHGTNDPIETAHDLSLLLGVSLERFLETSPDHWRGNIRMLRQDLAGARGWDSAEQMFEILNNTIRYAVLRNFQGFPRQLTLSGHEDVDFITDDYDNFVYLINARKVVPETYRVQHQILINGNHTFIDVRSTSDGYYDPKWAEDLLNERTLWNGLYVPTGDRYFYALVYHALVHKWRISDDYLKLIKDEFGTDNLEEVSKLLRKFMKQEGYSFVEPKDLSVGFNDQRWSIKRKLNEYMMKFKRLKLRLANA